MGIGLLLKTAQNGVCVRCAKSKGWPGEAFQVLFPPQVSLCVKADQVVGKECTKNLCHLGAPFMAGGSGRGQDAFRLKLIRVDLGAPQGLGISA